MTEAIQTGTPLTNAEGIVNAIGNLQAMLKANSPLYEGMLQTIHKALVQDEAVTWLLTEEQVGVIMQALAKKKNVTITISTSKNKSSSGKKLSEVTEDDI